MSNPSQLPKKWKLALLVWCFIFPVISTISAVIQLTGIPLHPIVRLFFVSILVVPMMIYFYLPFVNRRFFDWLRK